MASSRVSIRAATGLTVYAVVFRLSDGKAFDWDDDAFDTLGSVTTPAVSLTGLVTFGTTQREYAGDIDLETINATSTPVDLAIKIFSQLGGSPAPATDTYLGEVAPFTCVFGQRLKNASSYPAYTVVVTVSTTSTAGTTAHVKVQVLDESNQLLDLNTLDSSATCEVEVIRDGPASQFSLSTSDFGAPKTSGCFEATYNNPNFTADKGYTAIATVVMGGRTYKGASNFNVWP